MTRRFASATQIPHMLHGGDYNPEQWLAYPEVLRDDLRLMKLAGVNIVSIGIFSWAMLEPAEGCYDFDWLHRIVDDLWANGISVNLATPSGAKPNWMAQKYPEIRRVNAQGLRDLQGFRHNHCYTSPVYRAKATQINTRLAESFKDHPALAMWHISNEYGGECHCDLCKAAFRLWLQQRYQTLDNLNHAWWSTFWSHRFTDWSQIEFIDPSVHGLVLDWKRFVTHQTADFMGHEIVPLKNITPNVPVTTNLMGTYMQLDYWKLAEVCDVVSWDAYPGWHKEPEAQTALYTAFNHDLNRGLKKGQPFLLMESTPSQVNWQDFSPLKRPLMHQTASLQAVAHGADAVMYFQWRKSRGSSEKFHGAVVDHVGHENTRTFREVAELGQLLGKLDAVVGAATPSETALVFDWENRWAIEGEQGPRNREKNHDQTAILDFYRPFWQRHIPVDIIAPTFDFANYRLLLAPMMYLLQPGVAQRVEQFVAQGGTFVTTYFSGIVNETDLCFQGGFPGPLRPVLGVWVEETDVPGEHTPQSVLAAANNQLGLNGSYAARHYCDLVHVESKQVQVLAEYERDFYARRAALTVHHLGKGKAYYIASRNDDRFHDDFFTGIAKALNLRAGIDQPTPPGVSVQRRSDGRHDYLFYLNFTHQVQTVPLPPRPCINLFTGQPLTGSVELPAFGSLVVGTR